ncbi:MAG: hypothetical protein JOY62_08130 [Acidobacteriaceae bacterium]|nr:hypothetical protein [Acidobacteriaceae bacterium]MBV9779928.1 hypothetical protein [Acidobacteriaceae bacterium]
MQSRIDIATPLKIAADTIVHMAAHTPKREAIERFVQHESAARKNWIIRVVDEEHDPVIRLHAWRDDKSEAVPEKSLEVHSRQVRLFDEELDEASKTLIRRWLASL